MTDSEILAAIDAAQQQHEDALLCLCGCRATPAPGRCFVAQVCFERWLARDRHPDRRAPVQPLPDRTAEYVREREAAEQRHAECPPVRRRPDDEPWAVLDRPDAVPERPRYAPGGPVAGGPVVLGETSCPLPWPPVDAERAELRRRLEEELVGLPVEPLTFADLREEATCGPASGHEYVTLGDTGSIRLNRPTSPASKFRGLCGALYRKLVDHRG